MAHIRKHSKTGFYEYRRIVPSDLRANLGPVAGFEDKPGRANLTKSLGTTSKPDANRQAAALNLAVEAAFAEARKPVDDQPTPQKATPSITPEVVRSAFEQWEKEQIEAIKLAIWNGEEDFGPFAALRSDTDEWRALYRFTRGMTEHLDYWQQIPHFDALLIQAAESVGLQLDPTKPVFGNIRPFFGWAWRNVIAGIDDNLRNRRRLALGWKGASTQIVATRDPAPISSTPMAAPVSNFDAHVERWADYVLPSLKSRQTRINKRVIQDFASFEDGVFVETVSRGVVQRWVEKLLTKDNLSPKTAKTKVAALTSYWRWLQSNDLADNDRNPFERPYIKGAKSLKPPREKWTPSEVVQLWRAALDKKQIILADAIRIAAFSGARIESIFQLKVVDVGIALSGKGMPIITLSFADKTMAGVRTIPVHSSLCGLIERLKKESAIRDGYLMPSTANNQDNERSTPVGKQFGRLKTELGFDRTKTFHCLRKTVASMFQNAREEEAVAADVMGHRKPTMTYGLYGGKSDIEVMREAVEKLAFPDPNFMRG